MRRQELCVFQWHIKKASVSSQIIVFLLGMGAMKVFCIMKLACVTEMELGKNIMVLL